MQFNRISFFCVSVYKVVGVLAIKHVWGSPCAEISQKKDQSVLETLKAIFVNHSVKHFKILCYILCAICSRTQTFSVKYVPSHMNQLEDNIYIDGLVCVGSHHHSKHLKKTYHNVRLCFFLIKGGRSFNEILSLYYKCG